MKIDPNAPAYPHPDNWMPDGTVKPASGLTIRAEFAKAQMQVWRSVLGEEAYPDVVAANAVSDADALIAALKEPKP